MAVPISRLLLLQPNLATPERKKNEVGSMTTTRTRHPSGGGTDTKKYGNHGCQETKPTSNKDISTNVPLVISDDEGLVDGMRPEDVYGIKKGDTYCAYGMRWAEIGMAAPRGHWGYWGA